MATKKTRLDERRREVLKDLVTKLVVVDQREAEREAMAKQLDAEVLRLVLDRYPQSDMKTLLKYDVAVQDRWITLQLTNGRVVQVLLDGDDSNLPLVSASFNCGHRICRAGDLVTELYQSLERMAGSIQEEKRQLQAPYFKLIRGANTYEDVLAVWPEAEQVRAELGATGTGIVRGLDEADIAAIQADMARRNSGE